MIKNETISISHEIRNPMTTVRGFLQLLKEKDRAKELLQKILIKQALLFLRRLT